MTNKSIELCHEQIDQIVIDELIEAADMVKHDKDQTLFVSLINVLKYYMVPSDYEQFLESHSLL